MVMMVVMVMVVGLKAESSMMVVVVVMVVMLVGAKAESSLRTW